MSATCLLGLFIFRFCCSSSWSDFTSWFSPHYITYKSLIDGASVAVNVSLAALFVFSLHWMRGKLQWARGENRQDAAVSADPKKDIPAALNELTRLIGTNTDNPERLDLSFRFWLASVALDAVWFSASVFAHGKDSDNLRYPIFILFAWLALSLAMILGWSAYWRIYRHLQRPWDFQVYEKKSRLPDSWRAAKVVAIDAKTSLAQDWQLAEEREQGVPSTLTIYLSSALPVPLLNGNDELDELYDTLRRYYYTDDIKYERSAVLAERVGMAVRWFGLLNRYPQRRPHRRKPPKDWLRDAEEVVKAVFAYGNRPEGIADQKKRQALWQVHYAGTDAMLISNALEYAHCEGGRCRLREPSSQECPERVSPTESPYCCSKCLQADPCENQKDCAASYFLCEFVRQCFGNTVHSEIGALLLVPLLAHNDPAGIRSEEMAFALWLMMTLRMLQEGESPAPAHSILVPLQDNKLDMKTVLGYYFLLRFWPWLQEYINSSALDDDRRAQWKKDIRWMRRQLGIKKLKRRIRDFPLEDLLGAAHSQKEAERLEQEAERLEEEVEQLREDANHLEASDLFEDTEQLRDEANRSERIAEAKRVKAKLKLEADQCREALRNLMGIKGGRKND